MKKSILIIFLFLSILSLNAQDYLINFSGTGSSTSVETVTVENLTQGKSITFSGSKTLRLMGTVTANTPLLEYLDYPLIVYPNPSSGDISIQFEAQKSGSATVVLFDIAGREINRLQQRIQNGFQSFKVTGLSNGVYTVQVLQEDQKFTKKVVCSGKSSSKATITYNGFSQVEQSIAKLKSVNSEQSWQYNTGDRLKFQGTSSKYSTIVMDVPTQNKTLSFNFVECTDADGNNYPVVKIGNQFWMAENLKTTKYNDGTPIQNETDNVKWTNLTTGAYCWNNNDINNKTNYGALYNWFAVGTKKLAPINWHVASNADWATLISFNGGTSNAGGKLKEIGSKHWISPNTNATDEYGFTALPGGVRLSNPQSTNTLGIYANIGGQGDWWTLSEVDDPYSWNAVMGFGLSSTFKVCDAKQNGFSVRCVQDVIKPITTFVSKAPVYEVPNNTVGQIKTSYFFPGFYDHVAESKYNIYGPMPSGGYGLYYRFNESTCIYFDYNNDGMLDMFSFLTNFKDDPWGSKPGKYMLVKNVLYPNPEIKYFDCTTRIAGGNFELNDLNNDGVNELIQWGDESEALSDGSYGVQVPLKIITFQSDGNFSIKEIGDPMAEIGVTTGDVDNDGDIDILAWRYKSNGSKDESSLPLLYYLNDGKGNFTLQNSSNIFSGLEELINSYGQYVVYAVVLFDLNNDGYLDIVSGQNIGKSYPENGGPQTPNCRIYWGNAQGIFDFKNNYADLPNVSIKDFSKPNQVLGFSFIDYDNDDDYDVLAAITPNNTGFYVQLYENLGNKTFKDVTESRISGYYNLPSSTEGKEGDFPSFYNVGLFDIDDDGDFDIVPRYPGNWTMYEYSPNMYWENIGSRFVRKNL